MRNQAATENAQISEGKSLEDQVLDQTEDSLWTDLARDPYQSSEDFYKTFLGRGVRNKCELNGRCRTIPALPCAATNVFLAAFLD